MLTITEREQVQEARDALEALYDCTCHLDYEHFRCKRCKLLEDLDKIITQ